ncbi:MAG TPA: TolC family protein [Vicinamibacterales bacterium]
MFGRDCFSIPVGFCRRVPAMLMALFLLPGIATAQQSPSLNLSGAATLTLPGQVRAGVHRITLADAQQLAQAATDPLVRLGRLQVEAAEEHRKGVRSMYFPSVSTQFFALHLTTEPGELLTFQRPLTGALLSVPIQVVFQNQNAVNVVATQPITQLWSIRQLVKIARADENIARAKAGLPVMATARHVEKSFFELLVAEREYAAADFGAKSLRASWATSGDSGPSGITTQPADTLREKTSASLLASKVATLTASLNGLLGLAPDTRLELVAPAPLLENMTLKDALAQAQASPPVEVIEAEQTAVKAHAAAKLAKLQYVPGVAVLGGYLHQDAIADVVLPESFAYVGVLATYTLFDSFKREHAIKEASANEKAADLGVDLAKAKAAAGVKSAYLELERSRDAYYLARKTLSAREGVTFVSNRSDAEATRARAEADVFRAEMAYRDAYATLTTLIAGN